MEIVAHGLFAAAAGIAVKRSTKIRVRLGWLAWWAVFPDVLAFGPMIAVGLWLRATGAAVPGGDHPHVHLGIPLYPAGHSLVVFLVAFGAVTLVARRPVFELLGWPLHVLIDIGTHSYSYYATRFLWPVSGYAVDGIAWWTPWFWIATYATLAAVYFVLWRKGWLTRQKPDSAGPAEACALGELKGAASPGQPGHPPDGQ
jgi:hypothetical protein